MLSAGKYTIGPLLFLLFLGSCKPVIHSFTVAPAVITGSQNVQLNWDASGKTSLQFHQHTSVDSVQLLEFTLVVKKGGNEVRQTRQVQKLGAIDSLDIAFATSRREGDTVIASGENNSRQWDSFHVVTVRSASGRDVTVVHNHQTVLLNGDGTPATAFAGSSAGGEWVLKTVLTAAEKADSTKIPEKLAIKAVVKPSNH